MNRKELIYTKLLELDNGNGIDAKTLASLLNMTRANVSHELNNLYREEKVYKSPGRPVLYFITNNTHNINKESKLYQLTKNNVSLKHAVEQMKAAILYPPKGIPSLLLGETGVGKSMFASLMYEYSVEMKMRAKNSPFIVFNCADYCNNPQLLSAQLFGVKKGTYTGAEADRAGLLEKANNGVLFLDEIHRLPPEGQEILFTFLDTGYFRRIGDVENIKSDVLIISATTEDPNSSLLKTFTRRIPMIIKIPSLKERSLKERLNLIKNFFKQESIKINRDIYVSLNTIRAFLSYGCPSNIGQLKSDIQLICAKAYSDFLTNRKQDVRIHSNSLPSYIKEGLYREKEHRILWNKLVGEEIEFFQFSNSLEYSQQPLKKQNNSIYQLIEEKLERLKSEGISNIDVENIIEKDITKYFEKHISGISEEINTKNLLSIVGEDVLNCIDKVLSYVTKELKRNFSSNIYTALALHINMLIKRVNSNNTVINRELDKLKELYPKEFQAAFNTKAIIEKHIHHSITEDEAGYLTIFLLPEEQLTNKNKVKIILIAHGESTATSMADVSNKLLGGTNVIGINAPIDVKPLTVLNQLRKFVSEDINPSGYLLLVDMGSLTTLGETIEQEFNIPIKVIPLVSTLHALEASRKAQLGLSLDDIYSEVLLLNSYFEINRSSKEPRNNKNKVLNVNKHL